MTRLEVLAKERKKYGRILLLSLLISIIEYAVVIVACIKLFIYRWTTEANDISTFKYSLTKYWYVYVLVIVASILKHYLESNRKLYNSFTKQYYQELKKVKENEK